jgi:negative regulator of sigma E activity
MALGRLVGDVMMDEKISAFLDGETSREDTLEILARCTREPALRALLDRQQRARAALRREAPAKVDATFADRVMARIAAEEGAAPAKVVELRPRSGVRWAAGLAMAASVTAVAILATNSFHSLDALSSVYKSSALTARNDPTATATPAPESQIASEGNPAAATRWEQLSQEDARQLNGYLISHNNYATEHGFGGAIGFTRVAASGGDELPADH